MLSLEGTRFELDPRDSAYPESLRELSRPPLIRGIGNRDLLNEPSVSIVGSRKATPYGLAIAEMTARIAVESGLCVVSGGAMGVDFEAGITALKSGGKTVVVAGSGANVIYPQSSSELFYRAVAEGGLVISLENWGHPPQKYAFPRRNRVIAALSQVLVVCEANVSSGTSSTAETALQLGRKVYAAPGSIFSANSRGTNQMIEAGANIIADEKSFEIALALEYGVARFHAVEAPEDTTHDLSSSRILSALKAMPMRPDDLACRLDQNIFSLTCELSEYEAKGLISRLPDGRFSLSSSMYTKMR